MSTPGNTGGQQPSPPTGQTSAQAAGSIRDRLSSPRTSDQASGPGDTRTSDLHENGFQQTDSAAALQGHGRGESQYDSSSPPVATEELAGRKHPLGPEDAKAAERKVAALFLLSFLGVVGFVATFFLVPHEYTSSTRYLYTPLLGTFMALALGGVGAGAVLWAKLLMVDEEAVQERHPFGSDKDERGATAEALKKGLEETGIARRSLLRNTVLLGAGSLALLPVPFLFGLGPYQHKERVLATTAWKKGVRLIRQNGTPVRLGDLSIGSIESVFPDVEHGTKIADSPTLLIRMRPEELQVVEGREDWSIDGHIAYSSVCTHLGCPVKLYEQQTHHLFCPCHQSTFAANDGCKVVFGPAARPLPQLAISLDDEGYFVAQGDYSEAVGPSYWERDT
ncbi:MAG: Ubiquinol-cytochrome C reductase iron-sulfur subunit [uncultured Frankineae bacterium]|uniref:Cytochrome bc1 complex Rieske iron-sulfur subunit n=1 Tax=uncultured Frankineae bacterium TaxID=437475 RepID=A0A6J4KLP0_9ACTN|nr:MAG: Ubiquinol-cytochrome C reductase iron-sulfur subunit [uncultured Frankineae bacterium]